jgi:SAM-dependent methyltransferase
MEFVKCDICQSNKSKSIYCAEDPRYNTSFTLVKCGKCGLVYSNPRLEKEELEKAYDDSYYKSITQDEKRIDQEIEKFTERFKLLQKYTQQGKLLSIGCGLGFDLVAALKLGWEVHGLEVSEFASDFCSKRYGIKISTGSLEDMEFPKDYFNMVTFWDSLEHMLSPHRALEIVNRWLKKDGIVVLRMPNIEGLFPVILRPFSGVMGEWRHPEPPLHLYEFGKSTISKLLAKTGFNVNEIISDEAPSDYLVNGSRHPIRTRIFTKIIYPIARGLHAGNAMIVIGKKI